MAKIILFFRYQYCLDSPPRCGSRPDYGNAFIFKGGGADFFAPCPIFWRFAVGLPACCSCMAVALSVALSVCAVAVWRCFFSLALWRAR